MLSSNAIILIAFVIIIVSRSDQINSQQIQCDAFSTVQGLVRVANTVYAFQGASAVVHEQQEGGGGRLMSRATRQVRPLPVTSVVRPARVPTTTATNAVLIGFPPGGISVLDSWWSTPTTLNVITQPDFRVFVFRLENGRLLRMSSRASEEVFPSILPNQRRQRTGVFAVTEFNNGQFVALLCVERECGSQSCVNVQKMVIYQGENRVNESRLPVDTFVPNTLMTVDSQIVAVYGPYYTAMSSDGISDMARAAAIQPIRRSFRTTAHWLGCPQEFCIDNEVDAAVRGQGSQYFLFRQRFVWPYNQVPAGRPRREPFEIQNIFTRAQGAVDAAFTANNRFWLVQGSQVTAVDIDSNSTVGRFPIEDIFEGFNNSQRITAAFEVRATDVWAFHDMFYYSRFSIVAGQNQLRLVASRVRLTNVLRGLPRSVSAAFTTNDNRVFIFSGNWHYVLTFVDLIRPRTLPHPARLSFEEFFICTDSDYANLMRPLGLTDRPQFLEFMRGVRVPRSLTPDDIPDGTTARSTVTSTTRLPTRPTRPTLPTRPTQPTQPTQPTTVTTEQGSTVTITNPTPADTTTRPQSPSTTSINSTPSGTEPTTTAPMFNSLYLLILLGLALLLAIAATIVVVKRRLKARKAKDIRSRLMDLKSTNAGSVALRSDTSNFSTRSPVSFEGRRSAFTKMSTVKGQPRVPSMESVSTTDSTGVANSSNYYKQ